MWRNSVWKQWCSFAQNDKAIFQPTVVFPEDLPYSKPINKGNTKWQSFIDRSPFKLRALQDSFEQKFPETLKDRSRIVKSMLLWQRVQGAAHSADAAVPENWGRYSEKNIYVKQEGYKMPIEQARYKSRCQLEHLKHNLAKNKIFFSNAWTLDFWLVIVRSRRWSWEVPWNHLRWATVTDWLSRFICTPLLGILPCVLIWTLLRIRSGVYNVRNESDSRR